MIKPIIQNASDQINGPLFETDNTIQLTRGIASLYRKTVEAINVHENKKNIETKEEISTVSGKDIRDAMNREMIDEGLEF